MDELKQEIKELIISSLELEDVKPEDINDEAPIFGKGLGLDSIDALELGVAIKKKFGVKNYSAYHLGERGNEYKYNEKIKVTK